LSSPARILDAAAKLIVWGNLVGLVLTQELADLASIVWPPSASSKPEGDIYLAMLPAPNWYLAKAS
jgi:hypothetical protein